MANTTVSRFCIGAMRVTLPTPGTILALITFDNFLRYLPIIGVILGAISFILRSPPHFELAYQIVPWKKGLLVRSDRTDANGHPAWEPYKETLIVVWNAGLQSIKLGPHEELYVALPPEVIIHRVCIPKLAHSDMNMSATLSPDGRRINITFDSIQHKEGAIISALHTENLTASELVLTANIRAIKDGELRRHRQELPVFMEFWDFIKNDFWRGKLLAYKVVGLLCLYLVYTLYSAPFESRLEDLLTLGKGIIKFYGAWGLIVLFYYAKYIQKRRFPECLSQFMKPLISARNTKFHL